jgi:DNA-binding transcriptional regulator PaaX
VGDGNIKEAVMKVTADEVLCFVISCIEMLSYPKGHLLAPTLEAWDCEAPWRRRLRDLRRRGWIEMETSTGHFPFRVTLKGRRRALGVLDPEPLWNETWNGRWLAFAFDMPVRQRACRARLLRWLHAHRFGLLQKSVWIRPDLPGLDFTPPLVDMPSGAGGLVVLQADCHWRFTDHEIIHSAWDFDEINARYRAYIDLCQVHLRRHFRESDPSDAIGRVRQERSAWTHATRRDPFLPKALWPGEYLGLEAWQIRRQLLGLQG